jgi:alkane 1-monooxygenase
MKWKAIKYISAYVTPLLVFLALYSKNYWAFSTVIILFVFIPFLELFTKEDETNMDEVEEKIALDDKLYDWIVFSIVPIQYLLLIYFLIQVSSDDATLIYKIGATTAFGMACGVLGINVAHELGHRLTKKEQTMSKLLLLTSLYMHFFIEHNRGHHKNVSTDEDPASSRLGETVYAFYFRSIYGSWVSAWQLEKENLKRNKHDFWSIKNEMLVYQVIQGLLLLVIGVLFGLNTLLFFIAGAFIGILLLETVNYIEHYGLRRKKKKNDKYERTLPTHSWNSNHPIGRLVLFELSRHSDHHFIASRKYQVLRSFENSPQMPTGYPGMMLLSLFPPLWFNIMNKKVKEYSN